MQRYGHNDAMSKSVPIVDSNFKLTHTHTHIPKKTMKTDLLGKWHFCTALRTLDIIVTSFHAILCDTDLWVRNLEGRAHEGDVSLSFAFFERGSVTRQQLHNIT